MSSLILRLCEGLPRDQVERTITKIGVRSLRDADITEVNFPDGPKKYLRLSRELHQNWTAELQAVDGASLCPKLSAEDQRKKDEVISILRETSGIRHGFMVTGRTLALTVAAYRLWAREYTFS